MPLKRPAATIPVNACIDQGTGQQRRRHRVVTRVGPGDRKAGVRHPSSNTQKTIRNIKGHEMMKDQTNLQEQPVLVTGATGSTGAAVLTALRRRNIPVRAMVRKPADLQRMHRHGINAVLADFDDPTSLARALHGTRSAYLVTPSSERAEHQQLGFVEKAAKAGLEHLVVLSQFGAALHSPVRFLRYHAVVEERVRSLGIPYTFLRPNLFFQGLQAFASPIAKEGHFFAPIGEARVSAVDARDIGEVGAAALNNPDYRGKTLTITGPDALSHAEMAEALSQALSKPVKFINLPPDAFAESL